MIESPETALQASYLLGSQRNLEMINMMMNDDVAGIENSWRIIKR